MTSDHSRDIDELARATALRLGHGLVQDRLVIEAEFSKDIVFGYILEGNWVAMLKGYGQLERDDEGELCIYCSKTVAAIPFRTVEHAAAMARHFGDGTFNESWTRNPIVGKYLTRVPEPLLRKLVVRAGLRVERLAAHPEMDLGPIYRRESKQDVVLGVQFRDSQPEFTVMQDRQPVGRRRTYGAIAIITDEHGEDRFIW